MTHRGSLSVLLVLCSFASASHGGGALQAQRVPSVFVRGVVFDSLHGKPLANAFVTIAGRIGSSATDSRGRFRFDSLSPGVYTVTAQHPVLDSIGLSGLTAKATAEDGGRDVQLAVPSFETLWRVGCRGRVPQDSGIVFGSVRRATDGAPVAGADIVLSWTDLALGKSHNVIQKHWRVETQTNEHGGYAVCGVPAQLGVVVFARTDSSASGRIDVAPIGVRVQRRDLTIGPILGQSKRGTITGLVTDPHGQTVAGARVVVDDLPEVRTDDEGHFRLTGVRTGTRQVEVLVIGVAPAVAAADVTPGDSAVIDVRLQNVVTLDAMKTMSARGNRVFAAEFDARRRSGFGYSADSVDIARYARFQNVFRDVPGLNVHEASSTLTITVADGKGGHCEPEVLIDGAQAAFGHLVDLLPEEVGGVEVYTRAAHIPARFVPTGIQPQCGMILVWTKYGFRNR